LLGKKIYFSDLKEFDPDEYNSLSWIKEEAT